MTVVAARPETTVHRKSAWPAVLAVAGLGGATLGALDLLLQRTLPYPWANLANSSAVWAVIVFAVVGWVAATTAKAMVAGVVVLIVAVEAYYLTATIWIGDSSSNLTSSSTMVWLVLAVVAGVLFGAAGSWWRSGRPWQQTVGAAVAVAVLLAEAGWLIHSSDSSTQNDHSQTALIEVVIALILVVVTALRMRRESRRIS